jgi:hypothetical protein
MCVVETPVVKHSDIMGSAVGLDAVVVYVCDIVIVKIDGNRQPVPDRIRRAVRIAVGGVVDPVVKIGNVVIGNHVSRRIVEISCHLGRKSSHLARLAAALASDKDRLCKIRTSILADFSKLRLFYCRVEGLNRDFRHTYNATD